ncbi:MAG: hypothetical protein WC412_08110 [Candidatus Omnitrophota bacterium]|jgi:type II secretory pathway component PulK
MKARKKGVILIVSLWILAILVIFALGIGNRCQIALKLSKHQRDRLKAQLLANAGINYVISELQKDINNHDSLSESWAGNKKIFSNISFEKDKKEFCKISYPSQNNEEVFGVIDEERRLNINNYSPKLMEEIFTWANTGIDAKSFSAIFNEWINSKKEAAQDKKIFKNEPLKVKEELLLILEYFCKDSQRAHEAYEKVKNSITVYGKGKLNINTTSKDTLEILTRACAETETETQAVATLSDKIIRLRDDIGFFSNISSISSKLSLETDEASLWNKLSALLTTESNYFTIGAQAFTQNAKKKVVATYNRTEQKIVYWHEE